MHLTSWGAPPGAVEGNREAGWLLVLVISDLFYAFSWLICFFFFRVGVQGRVCLCRCIVSEGVLREVRFVFVFSLGLCLASVGEESVLPLVFLHVCFIPEQSHVQYFHKRKVRKKKKQKP